MTPMSMDLDESSKQKDKGGEDNLEEPLTNDDYDDESRSNSSPHPGVAYCTFAVTGAVASFQPIFVCHDCFHVEEGHGCESKSAFVPLCICQACADICHDGDDHDVEYIGMGPCYCDCDHKGHCTIRSKSRAQADRLLPQKVDTRTSSNNNINNSSTSSTSNNDNKVITSSKITVDHLQEVFEIPCLKKQIMSTLITEEAQELIRHSKETFWIDRASQYNDLCTLEALALKIYLHHVQYYENIFSPDDFGGGAEWWVQVKDPRSSTGKDGAVDLHYDKDEALAEVFGLGSFPVLSTVTYVTAANTPSEPFNPTVVFDHTYTQGEDDMIDSMLVSNPSLGKHLVFDGKLLHGAPAHHCLRTITDDRSTPIYPSSPVTAENVTAMPSKPTRITFLVNIWKQKPAKVQPLPNNIREVLMTMKQPGLLQSVDFDAFLMFKRDIPVITLEKEEDLPEHLRNRIELPFVSQGATWEDQLTSRGNLTDNNDEGDDDNGGLVVVTFPPPPSTSTSTNNNDTMIVKFGPGLQAYLDYPHPATPLSPDDQSSQFLHESNYV